MPSGHTRVIFNFPKGTLYFNDQRMSIACWPNEGWTTIAGIIDGGARPRDGDTSGRVGTFEYSGDRPGRWDVEAGVWLQGYWCYDWYDETIRVEAIDPLTRRQQAHGFDKGFCPEPPIR
jgi:hypothetical protein